MRLLWARVGVPYSPATGLPIESQTVSQMVDRVMALPEGARLYLLAPVVRGRKGEYRKELADYMKRGFQRVKIDGKFYEIADAPALDEKSSTTSTWSSTAWWCARPRHAARGFAGDGAQARRRIGGGRVRGTRPRPLPFPEDGSEQRSARRRRRKSTITAARSASSSAKVRLPGTSGFTIPEIEPRLFSFNNPFGACPACGGLGVEQHYRSRSG